MGSVVIPGLELLLQLVTTWQSATAPRASYESWIKIRLLRDTRRVLECLPNSGCSQPCMYDLEEMTKR